MKNGISTTAFLVFFVTLSFQVSAQSSGSGSTIFYGGFVAVISLVILGALLAMLGNSTNAYADDSGEGFIDEDNTNKSLINSLFGASGGDAPSHAKGERFVSLKAGHDIKLVGEAKEEVATVPSSTFAVQPTNFIGISPIPKVIVAVGDEVKAGDVLFFDKKRPDVKYVSPVSGEVVAINRGAKRSIAEVVILGDKENMQYRSYDLPSLETSSREELVSFLLESGVWPFFNQRPYDIVADPLDIPKAIFISTFDSAPLAPNLNFVVEGKGAAFQKGLDVLNQLTDLVHLGLDGRGENAPSSVFTEAVGVEKTYFSGAHPSGNVGVQIHHVAPIAAGERVWTLNVQEVITIGKLFLEGKYDAERLVAVTGAHLTAPKYVRTYLGANTENLLKDNLVGDTKVRVVDGDVLSGTAIEANAHLGFRSDQITIMEEGDEYEMFGWLLPLTLRPSISKTYSNGFFPEFKFTPNTNTHGERRAFVVTGQYEKVLPMDIYPQHLMKAILVNDYERMEGLGIYELSEEDIALCEFACTSKQPLQEILRRGLEMMREQG